MYAIRSYYVLQSPRRGLIHHPGHTAGPIPGDNHTLTACRVGTAHQSTEVMGIGDAVEQQEQGGTSRRLPAFKKILHRSKGKSLHPQEHPLMTGMTDKTLQFAALKLAHWDTGLLSYNFV